MSFMRSDVFTRLLILVAACIAPGILVVIHLQSGLRDEQDQRQARETLREAERIHHDLGTIAEATRQIALSITQFPTVQQFDPACRVQMATLDRILPSYDRLEVIDEDGATICSSSSEAPAGPAAAPERPGRVTDAARAAVLATMAGGVFETGLYTPPTPGIPATLLFSQPFTGQGQRRGVIAIGLSLRWLAEHFEHADPTGQHRLVIADRLGTVLVDMPGAMGPDVTNPEGLHRIGVALPPELQSLLTAPRPGTTRLEEGEDRARLVSFVPTGSGTINLFTSVALSLPAPVEDISRAGRQANLLMVLGGLLAFALAVAAGQRFIREPAKQLLGAARSWSRGNLDTRLPVDPRDTSEFGRIAQALNDMAAALARQRAERDDLRSTLEARVAERTADLLKSRDRLQVALGEQAKSEASLRQAQKLQAVGQLAGGIAHDFNNLLTAVIGALELLRLRLPPDDARSVRLLDNALQAADRGGRLTSQLLAFSRRQRLLPVPTDLNQIVLGMISLLTTTLGREIRVETGLARGLWPALVDPHQVESAILNLAINARDAMPQGGTLRISTANQTIEPRKREPGEPDIEVLATEGHAAPGEYVMIRVSDTGTGMGSDVLARVFEPFFTTKQPGRGSGLGLSQVHGLAAQSGGEARVESEPGLGTSVSLLLPRAAAASPLPASEQGRLAPVLPRLRVLVADDDADVRRLTGEMLTELGHVPVLAEDGAAALAVLGQEAAVDVVLADYAMPGLNGVALLEEVTRAWPFVAGILVTGHADVETPNPPRGYPVLRKPFTLVVLSAALECLNTEQSTGLLQQADDD